MSKVFNTNAFFSGGNGMFIQYHDVVKSVYLSTILKMIITNSNYGLPVHIVGKMNLPSIIEWYIKRRYINPLKCLDYMNKLDTKELDDVLQTILLQDNTIYKLSPTLSICKFTTVYRKQNMKFPIFIYSEQEEPYIEKDCKELFSGISVRYLYGDLKTAIMNCDQNFTYILSDITLMQELINILAGTFSHILIAREYRYNYKDNCRTFKHDLESAIENHSFIRIGVTEVLNKTELFMACKSLLQGDP